MGKSQNDQLVDGINYGAIGFGALAVLAPRVFKGIYGLKGDGNLLVMTRLWGTRTAALGAIGVVTRGTPHVKTLLTIGTAMNAADALVIAGAGPDVPVRSRVMGALTAAAFAAMGSYVVTAG
ncbi:MAG TPA: hypothetical protein VIG48_07195 [Jatrophihabitans sp.]|jgi:hypothetical protein